MSTKANAATSDETDVIETEAPQEATEDTEQTEANQVLDEEFERLLPGPGEPLELSDGTLVDTRPLKLKELFAAFKIITRGAAMSMGALNFNMIQEQDQFAETMIALLINAFPEADQEFCEFIRICVDPHEPDGGWENRDERMNAEVHLDELLLADPDIGDAIDIVTLIIERESKDIQRLGKKVQNAVKMFQKVTPKTPSKK